MIDNYNLEQLVQPLQDWFNRNARVLPWRENPTAYYVWVSEIMLQQTRVEAVKPYFDRFIKELPDVKALAECPEDKLLKLWEGLGYYNRVRNLNVAAKQILEDYDGVIPSEYEELLKLKGIGHYTAGAISSIAYGKPNPAVDGNVLRVISRVTADDSDIMKQSVKTHMEEKLAELMLQLSKQSSATTSMQGEEQSSEDGSKAHIDAGQRLIPSIFNQALMELGATVCVPNGSPRCESCPWHDFCEARIQNRIEELPVKKKAKERRIEEKTVLVVKDGEQLALHKRENKGLLAGLYELPNMEGHLSEEEVIEVVNKMGYEAVRILPLCDAKHIFSHVEWHMKGYAVFLANREYVSEETAKKTFATEVDKAPKTKEKVTSESMKKKQEWVFVEVEDTKENYAIPSAFSKYTEYLNLVLGKDALL